MKIEKTNDGDTVVLKLGGCLDTASAPEFASALEGAASAKKLIVDFTNLEFISSSGLRHLVSANKKAVADGRALELTGMNAVVADVFDVTGLAKVFSIK